MIKNRTVIEVEVKGREFRLECFSESPLDEVLQAVSSIYGIVSEKIKAAQAAQSLSNDEQEVSNVG